MSIFKKRGSNLKQYLTNIVLIWLAVIIYRNIPYYSNYLRTETQITFLYLAIGYSILALGFYLIVSPKNIHPSKGILIFSFIKKTFLKIYQSPHKLPIHSQKLKSKYNKKESTALLFIFVKFFFLPLMLNFFYANFFSVKNQLPNLVKNSELFSIISFNDLIFPFALAIIFMFDTLWFAFGYTFESKKLKNSIRSVEPTVFGWAVALASYPPFNTQVTNYINWYANDHIIFFNDIFTFWMRLLIIALLLIYLSATFALGTKCSNLTNRGIVSKGPYKFIRHPAYIAKNSAWWLTLIPIASWPAILSMGAWSLIYHFRSITEERHLIKDPEYQEYCKKVKWRYIPFVY